MKNKKGFTLVELLAVIAILAVLAVIAVPSYNAVSKNIKQKMRDSKIETIAAAAELWAQDHKNSCGDITIDKLLEGGYIKADDNGKIKDPVTGEVISSLDEIGISMQDICKRVTGINTDYSFAVNPDQWGGKDKIPNIIIENVQNYDPFYYKTSDGKVPDYERKIDRLYMEDGTSSPLPKEVKIPSGEVVGVEKWELSDDIHFRIEGNTIYAYEIDYGTSTLTAILANGQKQSIQITNYHRSASFQSYPNNYNRYFSYYQPDRELRATVTTENIAWPFDYDIMVKNVTQNKDITSKIKDWSYTELDPDLEFVLIFPEDTNISDTFEICIYVEIDYSDCKTVRLQDILTTY